MGKRFECCCCNIKASNENDITFYSFPRNDFVRKSWVWATNKQHLPTTRGLKVCSKHFKKDDFVCNFGQLYIRKDRVPSIFDDNNEYATLESDVNQMEPYIDAEEIKEIGEDPLKNENEMDFEKETNETNGLVKFDVIVSEEIDIKIEPEDNYSIDQNDVNFKMELDIKNERHFIDDDSMDGEYTENTSSERNCGELENLKRIWMHGEDTILAQYDKIIELRLQKMQLMKTLKFLEERVANQLKNR